MTQLHTRRARLAASVCALALGAVLPPPAGAASARFTAEELTTPVPDTQPVEFDVYLPLHDRAGLEALLAAQQDRASAGYHHWLTPAEFAARFGPSEADAAGVAADLAARGLRSERYARSLHVTATAAAVRGALGTRLGAVRTATGTRLVALTAPAMSPVLRAAGAKIFAFSARRYEAQPYSHVVATYLPDNRNGPTGGYYYNDLKQAYGYPAVNALQAGTTHRLDGTGATIGVLMSADVNDSDIALMFSHENYAATAGRAAPRLFKRVKVDGGATTQTNAFEEASLDTQMELGGAPGAHVVLYEIPSLADSAITDALNRVNQDNLVDALSMSFGECEKLYTAAYNNGVDETGALQAQHEIFMQGNSQGITFLASSGDASGKQCPGVKYFSGGKAAFGPGASSPASDPAVTGVGGTNLVTTASGSSLNSAYVTENAWNDPEKPYDPYGTGGSATGGAWGAGGGASIFFATPSWQTDNGGSAFRTTPDVGMQVGACPSIAIQPCNGGNSAKDGNGNSQRSYVEVALNGSFGGLIGTSVASPEFASAVALLVELNGRQGNLNPGLYALRGTGAFHAGIPGYNGIVSNASISPTYNYTTGLGTPIVAALINVAAKTPRAGVPQTVTNP